MKGFLSLAKEALFTGYDVGIRAYHSQQPMDLTTEIERFLNQEFPGSIPDHLPAHEETDELSTIIRAPEGYEDLTRILELALRQSAFGKGDERHAGGRAFRDQPIMQIQNMVGHGYSRGQAIKKLVEAKTLLELDRSDAAKAELLGVIVYTAAAYLHIEGTEE